ncbi:hypothetical protein [Streptomyces sp. CB01881]|uniref:hypothetical protein n=1 Tax=Streptomyces sp. CB01881 TaxID=2078691 RepID=UPI0011E02BF5|nr:hypothetical protein [Streptomyces sp. CB01881]TYC77464.1 hypothetical protein EH183_08460 [Streptomyces sp. CB01881]
MSGCIARNTARLGMVAAAALGVLGTTTLPAGAAAPAADQSISAGSAAAAPAAVTASYHCTITADYGWRWEGNCRIYSGQLRTITYCANGTSTTGLWIGARPEPWAVWGNCPGSSWTRIVFQSRG